MLKGLSIYTLAGFLGAGINFLVLPLLSRYIVPSENGILSIYNTYASILIPFIGIMASGLINVEYYRMKNAKKFASLFSSIQVIPLVPILVLLIIVSFLPDSIASHLLLPGNVSKGWIYLLAVAAFLTIYAETFLSLFIIQKKPGIYALANLLRVLLEVSLTVLFVVYFRLGWRGRILSWLITLAVYSIAGFIFFYKERLLTRDVKLHHMAKGVKFGAPLILHSLGALVINQSDRLFITKYLSLKEAGVYSMGYQFGTVLLIFCTAFNYFFIPFLYERLSNITDEKRTEIVKIGYIFMSLMAVILLLLSLGTPFIFKYLIDSKYAEGTKFVFWTGLSYLFWGVFVFFSGFLLFAKKGKILALLSIVNITINVLLNFFFIPRLGAIGASYATCTSFLINAILIIYLTNRYFKMPWFKFNRSAVINPHRNRNI